jgi:hypothetical protein
MVFARLLSQRPGWASFGSNEVTQEGSASEMGAQCCQGVGTEAA